MSANPIAGIVAKIVSTLAFTVMTSCLKYVSSRYPAGEMVFFRSAFALLPLSAWLIWQGNIVHAVRTTRIGGHLLRSIIGNCSMFSGFAALHFLPLQDAIAIGYASPLIIVVFAALFLKENVRLYRWSAVCIGFIGVLIMLWPHLSIDWGAEGKSGPAIGAILALAAAALAAGAGIQIRRLTMTERTEAIVLYFTLCSTFFGLCSLPFGMMFPDAAWALPGWHDFIILVLAGILGGIGQILMTTGYSHADASVIAPFEYTSMIWALLIGYFLFGDAPTLSIVLGGLIVAATGVFIVWRERRIGIARRAEAEESAKHPIKG